MLGFNVIFRHISGLPHLEIQIRWQETFPVRIHVTDLLMEIRILRLKIPFYYKLIRRTNLYFQ